MKTIILTLIVTIMIAITPTTLIIKSPDFNNNDYIPAKYTCDGSNINPVLIIKDIPKDAKTLALILDDPDAPKGTFDHWVMWNIPPKEKIESNSALGIQGLNGKYENKYTGPCPPSGTHHYHFKVYALDKKIDIPANSNKQALLAAIENHIVAQGELIGLYKR